MGFNKVAVSRKNTPGWSLFWSQQRTMSNARLISTAMTWTFALAAIYCSLFYAPAFYDLKNAFGVTSNPSKAQLENKKFYAPLVDLLNQSQGYVMGGQAIEAYYKIEGEVSGNLVVYACQSPIIIEIFKCDPVIIKEVPLKKSQDKYAVQVNQNGFYGMTLKLNNEDSDFNLIWRRVFY